MRYFHKPWLKYKTLSGVVHRTSTLTPPTFFMDLCPFVNFSMYPLNNSETLGDIFLKLKYKESSDDVQRERLHNSTLCPLGKFQ